MKIKILRISLLVLVVFTIGFILLQQKNTPTSHKAVEIQSSVKNSNKKMNYPTFIGDEGIIDAPKTQRSFRKTEDPLDHTEVDIIVSEETDEETEKIEEVEDDKQHEKTENKEVVVTASNQEIEETGAISPKKKEAEKQQIVIPPSSLAITDYFLPHSNSTERVEPTTHVVLHFASNALNKPDNPYLIEDTYHIFNSAGVSANYVIDRNGKIYHFVPENRVAYHAGPGQLNGFPEYTDRLNHHSIGIELLGIGTREEMIPMITAERFDLIDSNLYGFTDAQYQTLNLLLNDIISRNPAIQKSRSHIVGHDEYAPDKTDPGSLFNWSKIGF